MGMFLRVAGRVALTVARIASRWNTVLHLHSLVNHSALAEYCRYNCRVAHREGAALKQPRCNDGLPRSHLSSIRTADAARTATGRLPPPQRPALRPASRKTSWGPAVRTANDQTGATRLRVFGAGCCFWYSAEPFRRRGTRLSAPWGERPPFSPHARATALHLRNKGPSDSAPAPGPRDWSRHRIRMALLAPCPRLAVACGGGSRTPQAG